jgi:hypothetical protein
MDYAISLISLQIAIEHSVATSMFVLEFFAHHVPARGCDEQAIRVGRSHRADNRIGIFALQWLR